MAVRTDLAVEEHALWERSAGEQTALPGVQASRRDVRGEETIIASKHAGTSGCSRAMSTSFVRSS